MIPIPSWAIGCFIDGKCTGVVRYIYNGRPGEPCLYKSRAEAQLDIEYPSKDEFGGDARPVRVRVELV